MSAPGDADPRGVALPTVDETFVLVALCRTNEDFGVLKFSRLESDTGLDREEIRRRVQGLAAAGLAEFVRSCFTEDGLPHGAGYQATRAGRQAIAAMFPEDGAYVPLLPDDGEPALSEPTDRERIETAIATARTLTPGTPGASS